MLNIHWSESITNGILYELTNQRPLSETIQQRQLRFIGHSLRRSPNELINQYALYTPKENNGKRRRGRPATIYAKYIEKLINKDTPPTENEIRKLATKREIWTKIVVDCKFAVEWWWWWDAKCQSLRGRYKHVLDVNFCSFVDLNRVDLNRVVLWCSTVHTQYIIANYLLKVTPFLFTFILTLKFSYYFCLCIFFDSYYFCFVLFLIRIIFVSYYFCLVLFFFVLFLSRTEMSG